MFKIVTDIEDKKLEYKFIQRLAELSGKLTIYSSSADTEDADVVITDKNFNDFYPVSRGLSVISDIYSKKTGKSLFHPKNGFKKRFFFISSLGGSGTSSIALVFSRQLAGKMGERVLLVDVGKKGSFTYGETISQPQRSIRELEYRAVNGLSVCLKDYIMTDHYGIDIITAEYISSDILDILELEGQYDSVVLSGINKSSEASGTVIRIINVKDSRSGNLSPECGVDSEREIMVYNREYINNMLDGSVMIRDDPLSFKRPGETVVIAMDGDLAYGVDKLIKKAVNEYEYV